MTYGQEYYKKWYAANREKQLLWQKEYYENHKEHVLQMHKNWAQKNVDQGGSVWRKYGRRRRNKNPNLDKEYRLRKKARLMNGTSDSPKNYTYDFFYWGPLLFRVKLEPKDLEECAKLCSKKASPVNETLAGVIKHEHYVNTQKYYKIIGTYLDPFRHAYNQWYGTPLLKKTMMIAAWANFMRAGEFNPPHIHSRCDFSSVLFINVPESLKEEHKKFNGTGGGPGAIAFTYGESQPFSINHKHYFPQEGELFIFPATLTHYVSSFVCKEERISISANFRLD